MGASWDLEQREDGTSAQALVRLREERDENQSLLGMRPSHYDNELWESPGIIQCTLLGQMLTRIWQRLRLILT